jgi:hypothetical protein
MREWDVEDALRSLEIEKQVHQDESCEDIAKRIFDENTVPAALALVYLAQHSPNEKIRLDSAKYVLERVLGKVGDDIKSDANNPLERLLAEIVN